MSPKPSATFTVQYREAGQETFDYVDGADRHDVRRVFLRLHPRARVLVVRPNLGGE